MMKYFVGHFKHKNEICRKWTPGQTIMDGYRTTT